MASLDIDVDYSEFQEALRQYSAAYTKKEIPDIVNQAARDVCFSAYRKTKGAKRSSINRFAPSKKGYPGRLFYALQNGSKIKQKTVSSGIGKGASRGKFTGSRTDRAWSLYNKRIKSIKYIATGWIAAAQRLGANTRVQPSSKLLRDSGAAKATSSKFYADIINGATGASKVGKPALQAALTQVAVSKIQYAQKRLEKLNKKYSAR